MSGRGKVASGRTHRGGKGSRLCLRGRSETYYGQGLIPTDYTRLDPNRLQKLTKLGMV